MNKRYPALTWSAPKPRYPSMLCMEATPQWHGLAEHLDELVRQEVCSIAQVLDASGHPGIAQRLRDASDPFAIKTEAITVRLRLPLDQREILEKRISDLEYAVSKLSRFHRPDAVGLLDAIERITAGACTDPEELDRVVLQGIGVADTTRPEDANRLLVQTNAVIWVCAGETSMCTPVPIDESARENPGRDGLSTIPWTSEENLEWQRAVALHQRNTVEASSFREGKNGAV